MNSYIREVKTKSQEHIEEPLLDVKILNKKTNAKTFAGWLIGKVKQARNENNPEVMHLLTSIYEKYMELEKRRLQPIIEVEIIEGWKGIDNIELFRGFENDFVIKSHTKNKETGKVTTQTHQIKVERVNTLFFWIKQWKLGETHKCYDFAEKLGYKDWKELWKERKQYFELYYFPIKCLEVMGFIKYGGRGEVTRVK